MAILNLALAVHVHITCACFLDLILKSLDVCTYYLTCSCSPCPYSQINIKGSESTSEILIHSTIFSSHLLY